MRVRLRLWFGLMLLNYSAAHFGKLQVGYYNGKCGRRDVEDIIGGVVLTRSIMDHSTVAALLRLHFHDCFVQGCDASILLDGISTEKTASANYGLRGFDVIDQAKAEVEKACPGVVSCADIIALATRDAISLSGGLLWRYEVPTGRRDSLVSLANNVDLPSSSVSIPESIVKFATKGLNYTDMVLLLGGHTVGVTHCSVVHHRLYNFDNTGKPDPTMDPLLAMTLRFRCPKYALIDNSVELDQNFLSSFMVDNSYYRQIIMNRGVLPIDQKLAMHPLTKVIVMSLANGLDFPNQFSAAMVKLGGIGVLTGTQGEIRRNCRAINRARY